MRHGLSGYGLYFYCLELITDNVEMTNLTFQLESDAEIIAHETGLHQGDVELMMSYMIELGLFENTDGIITCLKLAKRLDTSMTSNPTMRAMIGKIKENHDRIMTPSCKNRLDENRLEENKDIVGSLEPIAPKPKKPVKRFKKPTYEECFAYCNDSMQAERFINHYESNGWKVGKNPMANWKAALTNWMKRQDDFKRQNQPRDMGYADGDIFK